MSATDTIPKLDRPVFFNGQRLTAADLAAVQRVHREFRWLHQRSLHNWGIALGYAVHGQAGDRTVSIESGFALDDLGRELLLSEPIRDYPIPAVPGGSDGKPASFYLTVSYAEDASLPAQTRAGVCGASGAVRLPEKPLLQWLDPAMAVEGRDIVLGAIKVANCRMAETVSGAERRDAVPVAQPYIAAGQTALSATVWHLWPQSTPPGTAPAGVVTTVDVSAAGFGSTPQYQASVIGERQVTGWTGTPKEFFLDGPVQITGPSGSQFDVIVMLPRGTTLGHATVHTVATADIQRVLDHARVRLAPNGGLFFLDPNMYPEIVPNLQILPLIPIGLGGRFEVFVDEDVIDALQDIADDAGISLELLRTLNGMESDQALGLSTGKGLVVGFDGMPINPEEPLKGDLPKLLNDLAWHVSWMGVEG